MFGRVIVFLINITIPSDLPKGDNLHKINEIWSNLYGNHGVCGSPVTLNMDFISFNLAERKYFTVFPNVSVCLNMCLGCNVCVSVCGYDTCKPNTYLRNDPSEQEFAKKTCSDVFTHSLNPFYPNEHENESAFFFLLFFPLSGRCCPLVKCQNEHHLILTTQLLVWQPFSVKLLQVVWGQVKEKSFSINHCLSKCLLLALKPVKAFLWVWNPDENATSGM